MTCIRDIQSEVGLERELERIRHFFKVMAKDETLRIHWGSKEAMEKVARK